MKVDEMRVLAVHRQRFGLPGRAFSAPARVNLIGEHTDYTGGLVMPMAIGFCTVAVVSARHDGRAVFCSQNYEEEFSVEMVELGLDRRGHWSDSPVGVLWALREAGVAVGGFSMTLWGDVPLGAGLSSSASVEVATAMALLDLAGAELPIEQRYAKAADVVRGYIAATRGVPAGSFIRTSHPRATI